MPRSTRFFACMMIASSSAFASAPETADLAPLERRIAMVSDGHATYFIRLLEASLKLVRQPYRLHYVKDIPARRMWWKLGQGDINLFYGMQNREKDSSAQLVRVRNALTNGLIGQRVLLIRQADTGLFARIKSVEELKRSGLVAGFDAGRGDVKVWWGIQRG